MGTEGLIACQPRPFRVTTEADGQAAADMPDLVGRDFTADRPGVKFVGDITYIHTWAGFIYLATVIDCYSKKVVGWSIADHMRTELVAEALKNECVYRTVYATKAQARRDVIAYIEGFYNSRRRHCALDYKTPNDVHHGYNQPATAA